MTWITEHWLVLMFLLAYTAMLIHHAVVGHRSTKGMTDYYVGGRSMGGIAIGISFFATYSSTNSFVGFSGQAYTYGAPWLLLAVCAVGFSVIAWVWIAPRLRVVTEKLNSVTLPDYIGFRYGSKAARVTSSAIVIFASFLYMTAVFKGIGNLLEVFLDVRYELAIGIVFVIVMMYTTVGGFISVVKTDAIQGIVMIFAGFLLFAGTLKAAGGFGALEVVRTTPATSNLFSWNAAMPFPLLLGIMVAGTMKFIVEPRQLSRFYALKDEKATRIGMWVSTLSFLVVYTMLVPIGLFARRIFPDGITDTDLVVPQLLGNSDAFPPIVAAFLLVAMVAAAMSSLDSVLLVMGSTCARDIIGTLHTNATDQFTLKSTKRLVALFAFITALIALRPPGGIVALTAFSGSLYAACFLPSVVLGLYWKEGNGKAAMTSFILGLATLLLWPQLPFADLMHRVFPAMFFSMAGYTAMAMAAERYSDDTVAALFANDKGVHA
ncbi:MAG: sodium/solute symporter [Gemmatimonadota bacterium]|nr:sodium/solute symporter [Gemmatimonadota bacterium]